MQFNQNIDLGTLARVNRTCFRFWKSGENRNRALVEQIQIARQRIRSGELVGTIGENTREDISSISRNTLTTTDVSIRNILVSSGNETFMRSKEIEFFASALKPKQDITNFLMER